MATFTCPKCGTHAFKAVNDERAICDGSTPYKYPPNAPADVPAVDVPCRFVWERTDDALYFKEN